MVSANNQFSMRHVSQGFHHRRHSKSRLYRPHCWHSYLSWCWTTTLYFCESAMGLESHTECVNSNLWYLANHVWRHWVSCGAKFSAVPFWECDNCGMLKDCKLPKTSPVFAWPFMRHPGYCYQKATACPNSCCNHGWLHAVCTQLICGCAGRDSE